MADTTTPTPKPDPRALQSLQRMLHDSQNMPPEARAKLEAKVKELEDQLIASRQPGDVKNT